MELHDVTEHAIKYGIAVLRESLRDPIHAKALTPAKKKLAGLLMLNWRRQKRRAMRDVGFNGQDSGWTGAATYKSVMIGVILAALKNFNSIYKQSMKPAAMKAIAADYLKANTFADLTKALDATTATKVENAIAVAGEFPNEVAAAIGDVFDGFAEVRAPTVAAYSVNTAYNRGLVAGAISIGGLMKVWDTDGEACPICQDNAADGPIPMHDSFSGGADAPPQHFHCDCVLAFEPA